MWQALRDHVQILDAEPELRCLILRGGGDQAFAAGGDIEEFLSVRSTVEQALV